MTSDFGRLKQVEAIKVWRVIFNWIDVRTGLSRVSRWHAARLVPGGPGWTKTTGACLLWMFVVQGIAGAVLLSAYSPSVASAWGSVFFIEQTPAGAFLRGLHYFGTQALIILAAVHVVRIVLAGDFRSPRELVWVTGVLFVPLLMVWAVTGNPLSATQKGFAQITVESNIAGSTPIVGPAVRRVLLGGDEVGNLTLTHLSLLHMVLLPLIAGLFGLFYIQQVHRNALLTQGTLADHASQPVPQSESVPYWPNQSVHNAIVFGILFGIVAILAWRYGAPLDAPADPDLHHLPRPEWYFLFLFELRRYFPGSAEIVATMIIPGAVLALLVLMPLIDWFCRRRLSVIVRPAVVGVLLAAWCFLTFSSIARDRNDEDYQASRKHDLELAARARELAQPGIPPGGAGQLLRNDPRTQGPLLFAQYCVGCHTHLDSSGEGIAATKQSAPNLAGFASRNWVADVLTPETFASPEYFGNTAFHASEMVTAGVTDHLKPGQLRQVVVALSAEAALPSQTALDRMEEQTIQSGVKLIQDESDGCIMCHKFRDAGELSAAPDLTGYGSREWLIAFISDPAQERFYRDTNDRMPRFAPDLKNPSNNLLDAVQIGLLADWLRGQWYVPTSPTDDAKK